MFTLKNTTTVIALISFFIPSLLCAAASSAAAAAAASEAMTQSTTPLLEKEPTAFEIDQRNVLTYKRGWNFYEGLREMYMRGTPQIEAADVYAAANHLSSLAMKMSPSDRAATYKKLKERFSDKKLKEMSSEQPSRKELEPLFTALKEN